MVSISIFFVSLAGIISFVSFRYWELRRGKRFLESIRSRLDSALITLYAHISMRVPKVDGHFLMRMYHAVVHHIALTLLAGIRLLERQVVSILEYVRGKRELPKTETKSAFLKEVSAHKQGLEKRQRNIVE